MCARVYLCVCLSVCLYALPSSFIYRFEVLGCLRDFFLAKLQESVILSSILLVELSQYLRKESGSRQEADGWRSACVETPAADRWIMVSALMAPQPAISPSSVIEMMKFSLYSIIVFDNCVVFNHFPLVF